MAMDYIHFKKDAREILGIDLNSYKEQQMLRRINQWVARHGLMDLNALAKELRSNSEHRNKFMEYLTINTSHFFRDQMVFANLERHVLPAITQNNRPKIWSAGCSIGAEIYSIAMLLQEKGYPYRQLLASDIDETVLAKALDGVYLNSQLGGVSPLLLNKYFVEVSGQYKISEEIKKMVTFVQHDLLRDPYQKDFDLILCRNVFIYFTNETQKRLTERFIDSLKPGGYFIVGSAEQIMNPAVFGLNRVNYCIYQKQ